MKTLENYIPEHIEPVIAERFNELPRQIFTDARSLEEIKKVIHKQFVTTNEKITVQRKMDAAEIGTLRNNYPELLEVKLPQLKNELAEIMIAAENTIKEAKRDVQNAQDRVNACLTEMADIAHLVAVGTKDMTVEQPQCYCFPVCGHYLYYAWVNEQFMLVRVHKIHGNEASELFTQGEQNAEAFVKNLNINITAILDERKVYSEEQSEPQIDETNIE